MPVAPTYPGVYVEEIPSGVRTITGVATSITAFVGRAARGPVNMSTIITSYADFQRIFGGLWKQSRLGYAVSDFYQNGGSTAIVVRVAHLNDPDATKKATKAQIPLGGGPTLLAASEGDWGNALHAVVDYHVLADVATSFGVPGLTADDLFNLSVRDFNTGLIEIYRNLTVKDSPRRIDRILPIESTLVSLPPIVVPPATKPNKNQDPDVAHGLTIWTDANANTPATLNSGSDGAALIEADFDDPGLQASKQGIYALLNADLFNLLCIPPYTATDDVETTLMDKAATLCEQRRAMLLVDPRSTWTTIDLAKNGVANVGTKSKNAAVFFPRLIEADPLNNNSPGTFVPCGAIAGICARTDSQRGVWKAPAGVATTLNGVQDLSVSMTDLENGLLNPLGINCLRNLPAVGPVVWGSRTLQGDDRLASEWKYFPVRRTALFIEESLYRGLKWVVFEPNDEPLWTQIRLNVGAFMHDLFRQGAFQGSAPKDAYFVKCDKDTTTQNDINLGIVNIVVGFAPLKPAEFVIIRLQQMAGQIQV